MTGRDRQPKAEKPVPATWRSNVFCVRDLGAGTWGGGTKQSLVSLANDQAYTGKFYHRQCPT